MKLYATVASERATKGQGGNKFIEAIFSIDRFEMIKVRLQEYNPETNCYHLTIAKDGEKQFLWAGYVKSKSETKGKQKSPMSDRTDDKEIDYDIEQEQKGKRQKDENMKLCKECGEPQEYIDVLCKKCVTEY